MFLAGFWGHENGEFEVEDGTQFAGEVSEFLHAKFLSLPLFSRGFLWGNGLLTFIFLLHNLLLACFVSGC